MNGIKPERKEIHANFSGALIVHLANTYNLMLRLQNFHWNVTGPEFYGAHKMFESFYQKLWNEVDVTAERIRTLGDRVPGTLTNFGELSEIADRPQPEDLDGMLEDLITCCIVVREHAVRTIQLAEEFNDQVSIDMIVQQMAIVEKASWMFQSSLSRTAKQSDQVVVPLHGSNQFRSIPDHESSDSRHH